MSQSFSYESMGTFWEITIWDKIDNNFFEEIKKNIIDKSNQFDATFSRFKKDSLVKKISKQTGRIEVPYDFVEMLRLYFRLYTPSQKTLNPLIGNTISSLGYDEKYSLKPKNTIQSTPDLRDNVEIINDKTIVVKTPVLFDFGALGKGYFVDTISSFLKENNIARYLVNGSGDIYYSGKEKIKVGLEHPGDSSKVIGVVDFKTGAMCASATNRRKWKEYNHIINPISLKPSEEIIATWVIAESTALADALATALFLTDPSNFKHEKFEYLILNNEYKVKKTEGFNAKLY